MDQAGGFGPDCKWVIGGLAAFIMIVGGGAIAWIKAILKELNEARDERIADLKERISKVDKD